MRTRLSIVVGVGLLLAVVCNGAATYLKRVGLADRQAYEKYWANYCEIPGSVRSSFGITCTCHSDQLPPGNESIALRAASHDQTETRYLYQNSGYGLLLKGVKDALVVGFVILSVFLIRLGRGVAPRPGVAWPLLVMVIDVAIGAAIALALWGMGHAVVGLRSFEFLAVALVGGWMVGAMHGMARCLAVLLLVQVALVGFEMLYGMPLWFCPQSMRAAGTLVLPNSLGIFSAAALAFHYVFAESRRYFPVLLVAAVALIAASGSGTGLVAVFALLGLIAMRRAGQSRRIILVPVLLVFAAVLIVGLPVLTNRSDIFNSVFAEGGRLEKLGVAVRGASAVETVVGRGLGFGTNTMTSMARSVSTASVFADSAGSQLAPDSTVAALFTQLGVIGLIVFYGLLVWAFRRDPLARPIYLTIAVSSLTINILELFPVNFLLGLTLANTATGREPEQGVG